MKKSLMLIIVIEMLSLFRLQAQTDNSEIETRIPKYANFDDITSIDNPFDIPLYEIDYKGVKIPIVLTYDNTGIKVDDEPSEVGLKWSLNIGTKIYRKVNALPDESEPIPYQYLPDQSGIAISNPTDYGRYDDSEHNIIWGGWLRRTLPYDLSSYIHEEEIDDGTKFNLATYVIHNVFDVVPDEFSYRINGNSGNFFLGTDGTVYKLKKSSVKITQNLLDETMYPFVLNDGDGNTFNFKNGDRSRVYVRSTKVEDPQSVVEAYVLPYHSTFNIEEIILPNSEIISFTYDTDIRYKKLGSHKYFKQIDLPFGGTGAYHKEKATGRLVVSENLIFDEIVTPNEIIEFIYEEYNDSRYASMVMDFAPTITGSQKMLKYINITNKNDKLIKKYAFYYGDYFDGRKKLTSIELQDEDGNIQPYRTFQYNDLLDVAIASTKQDFYGYYNNNTENHLYPIDIDTYAAANRDFDVDKIKTGILEQIMYPTGGYIKFDYQPKSTPYSFNNGQIIGDFYAGGVVTKNIKYYDSNDEVELSKVYNYSGLFGYFQDVEAPGNYRKIGNKDAIGPDFDFIIVSDYPMYPVVSMFGSSDEQLNMFMSGAFYRVEECFIESRDASKNIGKIKRVYDYSKNSFTFSRKLISESYYSKDNLTNPLKEIVYDYTDDFSNENYILSAYYDDSEYNSILGTTGLVEYDTYWHTTKPRNFYYDANERLFKKTITEYDDYRTNGVSKEFIYTYNNYGLVESVEESKSHDSPVITKYKYPFDYIMLPYAAPNSQTEYYALNYMLFASNQINKPIEVLTYASGRIASGVINGYQFDAENNLVTPFYKSTIKNVGGLCDDCFGPLLFTHSKLELNSDLQIIFTVDDRYSKDIIFDKYDEKGNLLEYHYINDVPNSYIWGYDKQYVIAEAVNAKYNEIVFTSFEDYLLSNYNAVSSSFNLVGAVELNGKTGSKCFNGNLNIVGSTVLVGNYNLSYYFRSSIDDEWVFKTRIIQHTSTLNSISVDNGYIDDVRLYPTDAQLTTYTYKPLVGVTSITDPDNKTRTYEYDGFGRLKQIKDHNGNIIEHYNYHYIDE
jgi:YD repeat-containing protein